MADILSSVFSLVGLITDTASKAKINKRSCRSLARHVKWAEGELKTIPNVETFPALGALQGHLQECLEDLEKFSNPHGINRFVKGPVAEICATHQAELIAWVDRLHAQPNVSRAVDSQTAYLGPENNHHELPSQLKDTAQNSPVTFK